MNVRTYLLVTLAFGVPAAALSLVIWPPTPGTQPTPLQAILFAG
jgi:hypothetical protein